MVARNRRTRQKRSKQRKTRRQRGGEARLKIPTGCKLLPVTDATFATNTLKLLNSPNDACVASAWEQYVDIPLKDKKKIKDGGLLFTTASSKFYTLNEIVANQHARTYNSD